MNKILKNNKLSKDSNEVNTQTYNNLDTLMDEQEKLYRQVQIGDIIMARRDYKQIELNKKAWYRLIPYIVVSKKYKGVICVCGENWIPELLTTNDYVLNPSDYKLSCQTRFHLDKLEFVKKSRFRKKVDHLKQKDYDRLLKHLKINKGNYFYYNSGYNEVEINQLAVEIGDVIRYDNKYLLVIDILEDLIHSLSFDGDFKDLSNINYERIYFLDNKQSYEIVNTYSQDIVKLVRKKYNLLQRRAEIMKKKRMIKKGSILVKNLNYFYVYDIDGLDALVYPIYPDKKELYDEINIEGQVFYMNYDPQLIISQYDNTYMMYKQLSDEVVSGLKNKQKIYQRLHKILIDETEIDEKDSYVHGLDVVIGSVILSDTNEYYYVYDQEPESLLAVVISKNANMNHRFSINHNVYTSDLQKYLIIPRYDNYFNVVDTANAAEIEFINNLIYQPINMGSDNNFIQTGSVIQVGNNIYYIFNENTNNWLVIPISNNKYNLYDTEISINKYIYYANFQNIMQIPKNDDISLLINTSEQDRSIINQFIQNDLIKDLMQENDNNIVDVLQKQKK